MWRRPAVHDDGGERLSLAELQALIEELGARIGAPTGDLPTFGRSEDGARPHIEADAAAYHWVVVERGGELDRLTTTSLDELLYRAFDAVTFAMALRARRDPAKDFRRQCFEAQVELMRRLSPAWGERLKKRLDRTLRDNP
jgi:hypothetical protein